MSPHKRRWWWLSFCDTKKPEGSQFIGACLVRADNNIRAAILAAKAAGCNPGGEVVGVRVPAKQLPSGDVRHRLLSAADLVAAGFKWDRPYNLQ